MQSIQDQLGRHNIPADNLSRNLLKFFTASVGLTELRILVAQRVDSWLQNPKVCALVGLAGSLVLVQNCLYCKSRLGTEGYFVVQRIL